MDSLGRIAGPLLGSFFFTIEMGLPYLLGGILCLAALLLLLRFRQLDKLSFQEAAMDTAK